MLSMKNVYQNFSNYGISNNYAKSFLCLLEVAQLLIFIDIIFPIPFNQNYYFPIYFIDPNLYIEYLLIKSTSSSSCDSYYNSKKEFRESIAKDQLRNLIEKFFNYKSASTVNICELPMTIFYLICGAFLCLILFFFILAFDISKKPKKNSKEKEKNSYILSSLLKFLFFIAANFIYLIVKTFGQIYFTLISNFFIYPIFYYDLIGDRNIFLLFSLIIFFIFLFFSLTFLNFFIDSFNKKTFDQLIRKTPENPLLALKLIVSLLTNLRFNSKYLEFIKFVSIVVFLYNCYAYFLIFKKTNIKNFKFYCLVFFLALFSDRVISEIAMGFSAGAQNTTDLPIYYGFHIFLHFSLLILILVLLYFDGKKNESLTVDNMNYKLFVTLSDLLENMLNNPAHSYNKENNSVRLKTGVLREIKILFLDHQLVCVDHSHCFICKKINSLSRMQQEQELTVEDEIKELARLLLEYNERLTKVNGNRSGNQVHEVVVFNNNQKKENLNKVNENTNIQNNVNTNNIINEEHQILEVSTVSDKVNSREQTEKPTSNENENKNKKKRKFPKKNIENKQKIDTKEKHKEKQTENDNIHNNKENLVNEESLLRNSEKREHYNQSLDILDFSIKRSLTPEELEINNLLKVIYFLIIDQEKIHRVSYFIKSFNKNTSYKFSMILKILYEKIINYSLDEEDKNFILQKCVELNEEYFSIINILTGFVEALNSGKTKDIKIIIEQNDLFGEKYKSIVKEMKFFQEKYKFKETSQYYKYLWSYGILFNEDFDSETYLDSPENFEILDSNFHRNSNFIFKFDPKNFSWLIKKVPEIFINRFGYEYQDLLGKPYEKLFPTVLKSYEKQRLDQMMLADQGETQRVKTIMLDFDSYLRTIEISFEILPFISEKNFTVCNIHKIEERVKDNLLIINEKGEIINCSKSVSGMLGITPEIIMLYKDRMNLNKLFKIVIDYRMDDLKEIKLNYTDYLNYFVNTYLVDSGIEAIYEFVNFAEEVRKQDKGENGINVVIKIQPIMQIGMKISYWIFRVNNIFENNKILSTLSKSNFKRTFRCEDPQFNQADVDPVIENFSSANTYTQSSIATDYFSSATKVTGRITKSSQASGESRGFLSNLIVFLNFVLILIGILIMIYINTKSANFVSVFDIITQLRKFDSIYFSTLVAFANTIQPEDATKYFGFSYDDYLIKNFIEKAKISTGFAEYNSYLIANNTEKMYTMQNTLMKKMQSFFGDAKFKSTYNVLEYYHQMNGNKIQNFFFENLKLNINNLYTLTKLKQKSFAIGNIQNKNALDLDNVSQMVRNQIVNYDGIYQSLLRTGEKAIGLFETHFQSFQINVFVILFTYLVLHILLIILSFFQVKVFVKKIKFIFSNLNNYSKKEFYFINNKIKCLKQLINVEVKPSDSINLYKKEKKAYISEMREEREKQKLLDKKNLKKAAYQNNGENPEEYFNMENYEQSKNQEKFGIKYNYNFAMISQVINFIVIVTIVYLIYGIIVLLFFTALFSKISDCDKTYNFLNQVEDYSTNYLLNFKLNVLSPYQSEVLSQENLLLNQTFNFVENYPDNFYANYEGFLKILDNSASLENIRDFYISLDNGKVCEKILASGNLINEKFKDDFLKFCQKMHISNMNFYGIFSYYMKNNRNLYLEFLQTPRTWKDSVYHFSNEQSQFLNWIYLVFLNPFIGVVKDIILYEIFQTAMHQLSLYCIICFTSIIFIDVFIFMMMKVKVINKISNCQYNLLVISNTLQV